LISHNSSAIERAKPNSKWYRAAPRADLKPDRAWHYYNFVPAARRYIAEMEQHQAEFEDEFETVFRDE